MRTIAIPEPQTMSLHFTALDRCDGCGATLTKAQQLSGLCAKCDPPGKVHASTQFTRRSGKEG
jgi:predicted amidophosphoribosyltransferase